MFTKAYRKGKAEIVTYKGIKFRRYPEAKPFSDRNYYVPGMADRLAGVDRLHRQVYKDFFGDIPTGYVIHHKDTNPLNNDPSNLECLPRDSHSELHEAKYSEQRRESRRKWFLTKVSPKATGWHKSEEGRKWHSEHARNQEWVVRNLVCEFCKEPFEAKKRSKVRFCSNRCKSAERKASGVDNETRLCKGCGEPFICNKYTKIKNCSLSCGSRNRHDRKGDSL